MNKHFNTAFNNLNREKLTPETLGQSKHNVWLAINHKLGEKNMHKNIFKFSWKHLSYGFGSVAIIALITFSIFNPISKKSEVATNTLESSLTPTVFQGGLVEKSSKLGIVKENIGSVKDISDTSTVQTNSPESSNNLNKIKEISYIKPNLPLPQNSQTGTIALGFPSIGLTAKNGKSFFAKTYASSINPTILYIKDGDGERAIYAYDIIMDQEKKIIDTEYKDTHPIFSPDYSKIVFVALKHLEDTRYQPIPNIYDIFSKTYKKLDNTPEFPGSEFIYSPDGKYLYSGMNIFNTIAKEWKQITNPNITNGQYAGGAAGTDIFSDDSKNIYQAMNIYQDAKAVRSRIYQYSIADNKFDLICESEKYINLKNAIKINNKEISYISYDWKETETLIKLDVSSKSISEIAKFRYIYGNLWNIAGDESILLGWKEKTDKNPGLYLYDNGKITLLKELIGGTGGRIIGWYGDENKFLYINTQAGLGNNGSLNLFDMETKTDYKLTDNIRYYD
ncbi:MAG: hypothetical protein CEN91_141 [Candidatus Berkelbacteria bacterium Licking1014_85]|uniref:Uncharacterized protein n=1 Tax=Candidatus Berkelbacteria bacterium Licking1014_85 TaxID=2017148 RepID=A0A554LLM4_9BACT|nr:MAG: hypothetical protein CEN91_141 [Candidatus Berkelbacteria bacterium Licking1014_85]